MTIPIRLVVVPARIPRGATCVVDDEPCQFLRAVRGRERMTCLDCDVFGFDEDEYSLDANPPRLPACLALDTSPAARVLEAAGAPAGDGAGARVIDAAVDYAASLKEGGG